MSRNFLNLADIKLEELKKILARATYLKSLREKKLLLVPAANNVVRILPPLNVKKNELKIAISVIEECLKEVS